MEFVAKRRKKAIISNKNLCFGCRDFQARKKEMALKT